MWKDLKRWAAERLDQVFVPRELILRANDRITVLRLSVPTQKRLILCFFLLLSWTVLASTGVLVQELTITGKNQEIEQQRLDYFELLSEVSEYHQQFSRITHNLEDNRSFLLSMLRDNAETKVELSEIEEQLNSSEFEQDRVVIARDGLRTKLKRFESDLQDIAKRDAELRARVQAMQDVLSDTREETARVDEARAKLGQRLEQAENELAAMAASKRQMTGTIAELREQIATARQEETATKTAVAEFRDEIVVLESQLEAAANREDGLQRQIAGLQASLGNAIHRGDGLQGEKQGLESELATLTRRMTDMRAAQHTIVERLRERTELGVDAMERTVAMTGLELDELLARIGGGGSSQGGPFVAGNYSGDFDGDSELEISLSLLDLRLSRWRALQNVMRTLPLTVPLDQYSVSSGYGKRKDPLNGRVAYHRGLDFRAAMRAPVYTTAPGKVTYAGWSGPFGRMIEIDHGHGIRTRYAHLKKILVKPGQSVANREKIGLVGSSGRSTGPHLHYEVRYNGTPLNPMKFLTAGKHVFKD